MREAFIEIGNMPTHVATWGKWVEEDLSECRNIIVFFTGNPGLPEFYYKFLETLYQNLGCKVPVWILGHGGHEKPSKYSSKKCPPIKGNENLYNLQGQIEHKIEFVRKYIPKHVKVIFIGHSIGAYIALELLKYPDINGQVVKEYLLFPTIEYMGETPHGRFLNRVVRRIVWLLVFLTWFFTCLPNMLQRILIMFYLFVTSCPQDNMDIVFLFLIPDVIDNVLFMALDEMENVKERNNELIVKHKQKLKFYYGTTDRWAPLSYARKFQKEHPDVDIEICINNYEHAFVMQHSVEVGKMVAGWIEQDGVMK